VGEVDAGLGEQWLELADDAPGGPVACLHRDVRAGDHRTAGVPDRRGDRTKPECQLLVLQSPPVGPDSAQLTAELVEGFFRVGTGVAGEGAGVDPAGQVILVEVSSSLPIEVCTAGSVDPTWMLAVTRSELRSRTR